MSSQILAGVKVHQFPLCLDSFHHVIWITIASRLVRRSSGSHILRMTGEPDVVYPGYSTDLGIISDLSEQWMEGSLRKTDLVFEKRLERESDILLFYVGLATTLDCI